MENIFNFTLLRPLDFLNDGIPDESASSNETDDDTPDKFASSNETNDDTPDKFASSNETDDDTPDGPKNNQRLIYFRENKNADKENKNKDNESASSSDLLPNFLNFLINEQLIKTKGNKKVEKLESKLSLLLNISMYVKGSPNFQDKNNAEIKIDREIYFKEMNFLENVIVACKSLSAHKEIKILCQQATYFLRVYIAIENMVINGSDLRNFSGIDEKMMFVIPRNQMPFIKKYNLKDNLNNEKGYVDPHTKNRINYNQRMFKAKLWKERSHEKLNKLNKSKNLVGILESLYSEMRFNSESYGGGAINDTSNSSTNPKSFWNALFGSNKRLPMTDKVPKNASNKERIIYIPKLGKIDITGVKLYKDNTFKLNPTPYTKMAIEDLDIFMNGQLKHFVENRFFDESLESISVADLLEMNKVELKESVEEYGKIIGNSLKVVAPVILEFMPIVPIVYEWENILNDDLIFSNPDIHPSGVADLMVVKQFLKKYERAEISHITNVLKGEYKKDYFSNTVMSETEITDQKETINTTSRELETVNRFQLQKETERTISKSFEVDAGLAVSGKYGPTVEFSATLNASYTNDRTQANKLAKTVSRDITEKSSESLSKRVFHERRTLIQEKLTQINEHSYGNTGAGFAEDAVGVYQFLDKIYEAQVYNRGTRLFYDIIIPDPAALYIAGLKLALQNRMSSASPGQSSEEIEDFVTPIKDAITPETYIDEIAKVGLTLDDVDSPPTLTKTTETFRWNKNVSWGSDHTWTSEASISVVPEYAYVEKGTFTVDLFNQGEGETDSHTWIFPIINGLDQTEARFTLDYAENYGGDAWGGNAYRNVGTKNIGLSDMNITQGDISVAIKVASLEAIDCKVIIYYKLADNAISEWRERVWAAVLGALQDKEDAIEAVTNLVKNDVASELGKFLQGNPSTNLITAKNELKRAAISIFTRQHFASFNAVKDVVDDLPQIDFEEASDESHIVRFFESHFDWNSMTYVYYPYFWSNRNWPEKLMLKNNDPEFEKFLTSGAARLIVPVRRDHELPVIRFFEEGASFRFNEDNSPYEVGSSTYVSIVQEIKENSGNFENETPVDQPWDIRVPTPIKIMQPSNRIKIPAWKQIDGPNNKKIVVKDEENEEVLEYGVADPNPEPDY
jgi:hypothetical protein